MKHIIIAISCFFILEKVVAQRKGEEQAKDSLLLVKSIPICVSSEGGLFKLDIQLLIIEDLKSKGYKFITKSEQELLLRSFLTDQIDINDKDKLVEFLEKAKADPEYLLKLAEKAPAYSQEIYFRPCNNGASGCIVIERRNRPNTLKYRSWVFEYQEDDDNTKLISQIIKALTTQNLSP